MTDAAVLDANTGPSSGRRLNRSTQTYLYLSLLVVACIVLLPLIATGLGGFKTLGELRSNPFGLPHDWQWSNYGDIIVCKRYWLQMANSLWIAVLTVVLTL